MELGMQLLNKVREETATIAKVEAEPKLEGRQMMMVLAPRLSPAPANRPLPAAFANGLPAGGASVGFSAAVSLSEAASRTVRQGMPWRFRHAFRLAIGPESMPWQRMRVSEVIDAVIPQARRLKPQGEQNAQDEDQVGRQEAVQDHRHRQGQGRLPPASATA